MTPTLVIDASVAVKWFVREPDTDLAVALLKSRTDFHAPSLLLLEAARAFQRREFDGILPRGAVEAALGELRKIVRQWVALETLVDEALRTAIAIGHPVYDCFYLTLATRLGAPMITADLKFAQKLAATPFARHVVHLADWRA